MAGSGIPAARGLTPAKLAAAGGDRNAALHTESLRLKAEHAAGTAARVEAHRALRDTPRSASMGAAAAAHFQKGADDRAATLAAAGPRPRQDRANATSMRTLERRRMAIGETIGRLNRVSRGAIGEKADAARARIVQLRATQKRAVKGITRATDAYEAKRAAQKAAPRAREATPRPDDRNSALLKRLAARRDAAMVTSEKHPSPENERRFSEAAGRHLRAATAMGRPPPTMTPLALKAAMKDATRKAAGDMADASYARRAARMTLEAAGKATGEHHGELPRQAAEANAHADAREAAAKPAIARMKELSRDQAEGHVLVRPGNPAMVRQDYEDRKAARIERLEERSASKTAEAGTTYNRARTMASVIPFGQPIHIGHHSERGDRAFRGKIHATYAKAFAAHDEAKDLAGRAHAAATNRAISSDDPHAVGALHEKIGRLEKQAEHNLAMSKAIRSKDPRAAFEKLGESPEAIARHMKPLHGGRLDHWQFSNSNTSAEIRRTKARIEQLREARSTPAAADKTVGSARIHEGDNRTRVSFPGKPSEAVRGYLKQNGFRWSPSADAWQRQASAGARHHAEHAAKLHAGEG